VNQWNVIVVAQQQRNAVTTVVVPFALDVLM
jgi:hypothetical protein